MTTGLPTPSSYYLQLINSFPPRPINNESERLATQEKIDALLDKNHLTQDDLDYLQVLGSLIYHYEQKHSPLPVLQGIELLQALITEENLHHRDLISIFDDESTVTEVLERRKEITANQLTLLGQFFHLSPIRFLADK